MTHATETEFNLARDLNESQQTIAKLAVQSAQDKAWIAQIAGIVAQQTQADLKRLADERKAMGEKWIKE